MTENEKAPKPTPRPIDEGKRAGYTGPKNAPPPPTNQQIPKVVPDKGKSK